jgi:hypothetical protein
MSTLRPLSTPYLLCIIYGVPFTIYYLLLLCNLYYLLHFLASTIIIYCLLFIIQYNIYYIRYNNYYVSFIVFYLRHTIYLFSIYYFYLLFYLLFLFTVNSLLLLFIF